MKKVKKFIREKDIFGKEVSLNFDKKGNKYKTLFGGILTIMFYMFILSVTIYAFVNTSNHSKDTY